jgi:hypothetical protein
MDDLKELSAPATRQLGTFAEELSSEELNYISGGKRSVTKLDVDGDGKWDIKIVVRT